MNGNSVILTENIQEKIKQLKEVDIIVGIPSFNSARTIVHVVKAVEAGLSKYFSNYKSLLINSLTIITGVPIIMASKIVVDVRAINKLLELINSKISISLIIIGLILSF